MPDLLVTGIMSEPETDTYGNLSYWVSIDGYDGNVLVKHAGNKPILLVGQEAGSAGFERVDTLQSKAGNSYLKLQRPVYDGVSAGRGGSSYGGGGNPTPPLPPRGGEDPDVRSKAIRRMASHKAALAYIHAKAAAGMATVDDFTTGNIALLADWFDGDVETVSTGVPF